MAGILRLHAGDAADAAARFADAGRLWAGHDQIRSLWCSWAEKARRCAAPMTRPVIARLEATLEEAIAARSRLLPSGSVDRCGLPGGGFRPSAG